MRLKTILQNKVVHSIVTGASAVMLVAAMCIPVQAADVNLKIGVATPPGHPHTISAMKFAELVAAKSDGEAEVKVFHSGSIGNNKELAASVKTGTIDFSILTPSLLANYSEESALGLFEIPYMWASKKHMMDVTRGSIGKKIAADYKKASGIEILGYAGGAQRNMITKKPINSIDDLKGIKMRTWQDQIQLDWWDSLGAVGAVVPFPEAYSALQTGTVDGAENEFSTFTNARWAEVAKNIALTQHSITVRPIVGNAKKIDGYSAKVQSAIREAGEEVATFDVELEGRLDAENKAKLVSDYGVNFTEPNKAPLIEASSSVLKKVAADRGISALAEQIANAK